MEFYYSVTDNNTTWPVSNPIPPSQGPCHVIKYDTLYMDYSKTFDCVCQKLLLNKLIKYGINGTLLYCLSDYLTRRKQKVLVEDVSSCFTDVLSGVTQGFILGPMLFLLYITDIAENTEICRVFLHADDVKIDCEIKSIKDFITVHTCFDKIMRWGIL